VKINNAMSLLELHGLLRAGSLEMKIDFVNSAAYWRVSLQRLADAKMWIGVGRNIGEALKDAYGKYERGE